MNRYKYIFLLFSALFSCEKKQEFQGKTLIPLYPEPYHISMNGKDVTVLVYRDSTDIEFNDTLYFNKSGYLVREADYFSNTRYQYDSNGYLTKMLIEEDYFKNYSIRTELSDQMLKQYWYKNESREWGVEFDDVSLEPERTIEYSIKDDLIVRGKEDGGVLLTFTYDSLDRLVSKIHSKNDEEFRAHHYSYFKSTNELVSEVWTLDKDTVEVKKFLNGVLFSIEAKYESGKPRWVRIYEVLK